MFKEEGREDSSNILLKRDKCMVSVIHKCIVIPLKTQFPLILSMYLSGQCKLEATNSPYCIALRCIFKIYKLCDVVFKAEMNENMSVRSYMLQERQTNMILISKNQQFFFYRCKMRQCKNFPILELIWEREINKCKCATELFIRFSLIKDSLFFSYFSI